MPLKLNEPIVLTKSQDITVSNISIFKLGDRWMSRVFYNITDEGGNVVKEEMLEYAGKSFNNWWAGFQDGVFLYSEYISKKKLDIAPEAESEADFTNLVVSDPLPIADVLPAEPAIEPEIASPPIPPEDSL